MKNNFLSIVALMSLGILTAQEHCCNYGPLTKKYNFTIFGGVVPSVFSSRGQILAVVPPLTPAVFVATKNAQFSTAWEQPALNISGNFGYTAADHIELFIECNYHRAKSKDYSLFTTNPGGGSSGIIRPNITDFQSINGYTGFRWYGNRFLCNRISFFIGSKAGFVSYKKINAEPLTIISGADPTDRVAFNTLYCKGKMAASAGLQAGFDVRIFSGVSLFLNAEVIGSGGMPPVTNLEKPDVDALEGFTNYIRTPNGTLVSFPVNVGLRFWFC